MTLPHPGLAELALLLQRQGEAARDGDADALDACSAQIRQRLNVLARTPLPKGEASHSALQALLQQCVRNQALVARRQHDAERSLAALRAGAPDAPLAQAVYGARGTFAAGRPGRGFGAA